MNLKQSCDIHSGKTVAACFLASTQLDFSAVVQLGLLGLGNRATHSGPNAPNSIRSREAPQARPQGNPKQIIPACHSLPR